MYTSPLIASLYICFINTHDPIKHIEMKNNVSLFKQLISGLTSKLLFRLLFVFKTTKNQNKTKKKSKISQEISKCVLLMILFPFCQTREKKWTKKKQIHLDYSCWLLLRVHFNILFYWTKNCFQDSKTRCFLCW